jgi:hypothetical protein
MPSSGRGKTQKNLTFYPHVPQLIVFGVPQLIVFAEVCIASDPET